MAKKIKRSVSSGSPVESNAPATFTRPSTGFTASRPSYTAEFKPDYSLIISDLKKIGGLASVFTIILLAVSFFLR